LEQLLPDADEMYDVLRLRLPGAVSTLYGADGTADRAAEICHPWMAFQGDR
jgi:hypothetical protein